MQSKTANAKCATASLTLGLKDYFFMLWMLMFCIAENIVHGELDINTAGLTSSKRRIA